MWLDSEKGGWHEGILHFYCLVYVWFCSAVNLPNRPVKWSGSQNIWKTEQVSGGYQGSYCEVNNKPCSSWIFFFSPGSCLRLKIRISVYLKKAVLCLSAMGLEESRHSVDPGGNPLMLGFPEMAFFLLPFRPVWHSLSTVMKVSSSMPDPQEPGVYVNRVASYNSYLKFLLFLFPQKLQ